MKNTKKLILSIIAIIIALSSAFSVYAYPSVEGFGTYEDGIIPPSNPT